MSEIFLPKKPGRPRKSHEEFLQAIEVHREKAKERYQQNAEKCRETTKQYQKRQRDIYQIIKELVKNDRLDEVIQDEEVRTKIKEVLS
jgi:hypothetical protein